MPEYESLSTIRLRPSQIVGVRGRHPQGVARAGEKCAAIGDIGSLKSSASCTIYYTVELILCDRLVII